MLKKNEKFWRFALVSTVLTISLSIGCSSAKKKEEEEGGVPSAASADENSAATGTGDSDDGKAMGLQTIHFPYDAFLLTEEAKAIASSNAAILKKNSHVKIQIEGHCDQRGGIQYNIALGEKRAHAVKSYMQDIGIHSDRITIISFGKEKPIDTGTSDEAYAKNRRANFVITSH